MTRKKPEGNCFRCLWLPYELVNPPVHGVVTTLLIEFNPGVDYQGVHSTPYENMANILKPSEIPMY